MTQQRRSMLEGYRVLDFTHFVAGPDLHANPGRDSAPR